MRVVLRQLCLGGRRWAGGKVKLLKREAAAPRGGMGRKNLSKDLGVEDRRPPLPAHKEVVDTEQATVKRRQIDLDNPEYKVNKYIPKAGMVVFIAENSLCAGVAGMLSAAGVIDISVFKSFVAAYPVHELIPFEFVKQAYVTFFGGALWSLQFLMYRIPFQVIASYSLASRMRKNAYLYGTKQYSKGDLFSTEYLLKLLTLAPEILVVIVCMTYILLALGAGKIRESFPQFVQESITHCNGVLRGYIGTNDWPTEDELTCFSFSLLFAEMYTTMRTRAVQHIYKMFKDVAKLK